MSSSKHKSQRTTRVGECLYRDGNGNYVALVKVKGKQIKRSLGTNDRQLANRRLADFRATAQRLGTQHKNIQFEELAKEWLASIEGDLKPASHRRRKVAVNVLKQIFGGQLLRSMGYTDIAKWK